MSSEARKYTLAIIDILEDIQHEIRNMHTDLQKFDHFDSVTPKIKELREQIEYDELSESYDGL